MFGLKRKDTPIKDVLGNADVREILDKFIQRDLPTASAIIIIWEQNGNKKQTYWDCGGVEPAQAILTLDQLHHRVQHEGIKKYE